MFANSMDETKTSTEKAYQQMFASQIGDIGFIMNAILAAVFFTILLVTGNTMSQSIRERTSELAVFKTIGFSDMTVMTLVLIESLVLCIIGALLGLQGVLLNHEMQVVTFLLGLKALWAVN